MQENTCKYKILKGKKIPKLIKTLEPLMNEIEKNKMENYIENNNMTKVLDLLSKKEKTRLVNLMIKTSESGLKKIVEKVDVNLRDEWGFTPFMRAVMNGDAGKVSLLLDCGANPNLKHHSVKDFWNLTYMMATKINDFNERDVNIGIVLKLIEKNINLNEKNRGGKTALDIIYEITKSWHDDPHRNDPKQIARLLSLMNIMKKNGAKHGNN